MLSVHEVDVPPSERRFHRLSGRVSLDLVATVGERWRRRFERLTTPADLDRWLAVVERPASPPATAADLAAARRLRGAVEALVVAAMRGEALPREAVDVLNATASRPDAPPRLVAVASDGDGDVTVDVPPAPVAEMLSAVARDAVDLLGGPLAPRIRECAADDCALVYVDTSRAGSRRWCSMAGCGNRTKVARHRERHPSERRGRR